MLGNDISVYMTHCISLIKPKYYICTSKECQMIHDF